MSEDNPTRHEETLSLINDTAFLMNGLGKQDLLMICNELGFSKKDFEDLSNDRIAFFIAAWVVEEEMEDISFKVRKKCFLDALGNTEALRPRTVKRSTWLDMTVTSYIRNGVLHLNFEGLNLFRPKKFIATREESDWNVDSLGTFSPYTKRLILTFLNHNGPDFFFPEDDYV